MKHRIRHLDNSNQAAAVLLLWAAQVEGPGANRIWQSSLAWPALTACGLWPSDIPWLVRRNIIVHRVKGASGSTGVGKDGRRTLGQPVGKESRFVLTKAGTALAPRLFKFLHESGKWTMQPRWTDGLRILSVGAFVVKTFKLPAQAQIAILAAFESKSWPARVFDPVDSCDVCDRREGLHDGIKRLNRSQSIPLLRFHGDGTGRGVHWSLTSLASRLVPNGFGIGAGGE